MTTDISIIARFKNEASRGLRGLKADVDGVEKSTDKANQSTKGLGNSVGSFLPSMATVGIGALVGLTAAAVSFGVDSTAAFKDFETGMAEVFTLLPGLSASAREQMEGDVLALSSEIGRLPEEVIPALYQALSAGVPPENVFDFLRSSSTAAVAGVTDLGTAVDATSSVVNAYGSDVITAAEANDIMFTAVRLGKTTFEEIGTSISKVTPLAASLGVSFEELGAGVAVITSRGTATSEALTQMRSLLTELADSSSRANKALAIASGQTFPEFRAAGGTVQEALFLINEQADAAGLRLSEMFGSVEATGAALVIAGDGASDYASAVGEMNDSLGANDAAAAEFAGGLAESERLAAAATAELKILMGEGLGPARQAWFDFRAELARSATEGIRAERTYDDLGQAVADLAVQQGVFSSSGNFLGAITVQEEGVRQLVRGMNQAIGITGTQEERTRQLAIAYSLLESGLVTTRQELTDGVILMSEVRENFEDLTVDAEGLATVMGGVAEAEAEVVEESRTLRDVLESLASSNAETTQGFEDEYYALNQVSLARRNSIAEAEDQAEAELMVAEALAEAAAAAEAYAASTGRYFEQARQGNATTLDTSAAMYQAAAGTGASAQQLAALGLAYGQLTPTQAEFLIQQSLIKAEADRLAAAWRAGEITLGELQTQFADSISTIQDTTFAYSETTGQMHELTGAASTTASTMDDAATALAMASNEASTLDENAGNAAISLSTIPDNVPIEFDHNGDDTLAAIDAVREAAEATAREYAIRFSATSDGLGGGDAGGEGLQEFMTGGYTGDGPTNATAGRVHRREYVLRAPVVSAFPGGRQALDRVNAGDFSALPAGGGRGDITISVDARGASDPAATRRAVEQGVNDALRRAGQEINRRSRL